MSGVTRRFLSRRDKRPSPDKTGDAAEPSSLLDVFMLSNPKKRSEKDEKKIKAILQRLKSRGIETFEAGHVQYALQYHDVDGDADKATELLDLLEDTMNGIVRDYDPKVKLLGAENRDKVTCYLDAILYGMFAHLNSFEAMLYCEFADDHKKRLAGLLRLWVNLLRAGRLITVDITKHIQMSLSDCGWQDAAQLRQQDASEAFTFITGKLELPLLTLKMDIYHQGKEDATDDHKFINERLLEVAIPEELPADGSPITLESCLEAYFNNRIEVKRHLLRRANTQTNYDTVAAEKSQSLTIEARELPDTPLSSTPTDALSSPSKTAPPMSRQDSIFSDRPRSPTATSPKMAEFPQRSGAMTRTRTSTLTKREVLMPAWQFFSLIPWYTDNAPQNDAQVAAHFSDQRPILGICLKRYSVMPTGRAAKRDDYVDIPLEIGLPHFIKDDDLEEAGPLFGNFKLSLQAVVCHRGLSVDSGHYISLVRGDNIAVPKIRTEDQGMPARDDVETGSLWTRFDDLATERVTTVDINHALKDESPYMLFYQVQPIEDVADVPPAYSATSTTLSLAATEPSLDSLQILKNTLTNSTDPQQSDGSPFGYASEAVLTQTSTASPRGRNSTSSNRNSVSINDAHVPGASSATSAQNSIPPTPTEDPKRSRTSMFGGARRESKSVERRAKSSSRAQSENRLSITMTRLKDKFGIDQSQTSIDGVGQIATETDGGVAKASQESATLRPDRSSPPKEAEDGVGGIKRSKSKGKKSRRNSALLLSNVKTPDRECRMM